MTKDTSNAEALSSRLTKASNNILKGRAGLDDSNACIEAAEAIAAQPQHAGAPDAVAYSNDDGDRWLDCPDDAEFVDGLKVGDTYELLGSLGTTRLTFRVTKAPDDQDDDYAVELVAAPTLPTAPAAQPPIDMILYCPNCGKQHVDKPEGQFYPGHTAQESVDANRQFGEWDNPPHRSHLCHGCGMIWRPADVATNGVASLKTKGKADVWVAYVEEIDAQPAGAEVEADPAFDYASTLAMSLFRTHYASDPDYANGKVKFELCDSTPGILTQIDNMVSSMVRARPAPEALPVEPAVWFNKMPESNGKTNWTVQLHRKGGEVFDGPCYFRGENYQIARYHADWLRYNIGATDVRPNVLDYDANAPAAVEPVATKGGSA